MVPTDLAELALLLGEQAGKPRESTLHIHPTQELDESGVPLGKIDNVPTKDGRQISFPDPGLISKGWHTYVARWRVRECGLIADRIFLLMLL